MGAFAAAVAAGALAYPDALRLVDLRARAMQEAYPAGYGMGVVAGLDERTVSRLTAESGTRTRRFTRPTSTRPCRCALPARMKPWSGFWTSLANTAPTVSGASPCPRRPTHPLMAPVAAKLERALAAVSMVPPAVPYLSNVGGRALRDPADP